MTRPMLYGERQVLKVGMRYAAALSDGTRAVTLMGIVLAGPDHIVHAEAHHDLHAWTQDGIPILPSVLVAHQGVNAPTADALKCTFVEAGQCLRTTDYAQALPAFQTWLIDGSNEMLLTLLTRYWEKVFEDSPKNIGMPDRNLLDDAVNWAQRAVR